LLFVVVLRLHLVLLILFFWKAKSILLSFIGGLLDLFSHLKAEERKRCQRHGFARNVRVVSAGAGLGPTRNSKTAKKLVPILNAKENGTD
jgi:hypothetical protein